MAAFSLEATPRDEFGKGAARRTRRAGLIPAVLYGGGAKPLHVSLPGHETTQLLRHANALIEITLGAKKHLTIVKSVQRDPVKRSVVHVDLLVVKKGEKIEVEVPVLITGEPFSGSIALTELQTLRLLVEATAVPENIEVSVQGLHDGTQIHAGGIELPEGATLVDAPDALVVSISEPKAEQTPQEAAEAAAAEAAVAE